PSSNTGSAWGSTRSMRTRSCHNSVDPTGVGVVCTAGKVVGRNDHEARRAAMCDARRARRATSRWRGTTATGRSVGMTRLSPSDATARRGRVDSGDGEGAELPEHLHLVEDRLVVDDLRITNLEVVDEAQVEVPARCRDGATG